MADPVTLVQQQGSVTKNTALEARIGCANIGYE